MHSLLKSDKEELLVVFAISLFESANALFSKLAKKLYLCKWQCVKRSFYGMNSQKTGFIKGLNTHWLASVIIADY